MSDAKRDASHAPGPARTLLRHAVATLAYRAAKALRNVPPEFGDFNAGGGTRTPAQILAHMGDLFDWALSMTRGAPKWANTPPKPWPLECERFFATLGAFDAALADDANLVHSVEVLLQGPVADALTHTGQIAILRRLSGHPVRGESYAKADIQVGRVSADQAAARAEFD